MDLCVCFFEYGWCFLSFYFPPARPFSRSFAGRAAGKVLYLSGAEVVRLELVEVRYIFFDSI